MDATSHLIVSFLDGEIDQVVMLDVDLSEGHCVSLVVNF